MGGRGRWSRAEAEQRAAGRSMRNRSTQQLAPEPLLNGSIADPDSEQRSLERHLACDRRRGNAVLAHLQPVAGQIDEIEAVPVLDLRVERADQRVDLLAKWRGVPASRLAEPVLDRFPHRLARDQARDDPELDRHRLVGVEDGLRVRALALQIQRSRVEVDEESRAHARPVEHERHAVALEAVGKLDARQLPRSCAGRGQREDRQERNQQPRGRPAAASPHSSTSRPDATGHAIIPADDQRPSRRISSAPRRPGPLVIPPPGCVPEPHW